MDEMIEPDGPAPNTPEFTVAEISGAVKRVIEGEFGRVRVRGEIGRVSRPRSGHIYLDLKDDRNVLAAVVWKGPAARLATEPEEGLEVVATGRLTTFGGQSRYQMVIDEIAPAGMGALMAQLERRRAALAEEGLFAPERKRALPFLPDVIGVITSPSGAVIRDILHRLRARFPRQVVIWPVAVQGAACAPEVARAIAGFNALAPGGPGAQPVPRPDLLIVARGGGSVEDLWGFNDEAVVRAAAASQIPLISAVGHETDTTLIDLAADRRAPTPSAAAEMAVPVRVDLAALFEGQGARLRQGVQRGVAQRAQRLADLSRALPRPEALVQGPAQRLDRAGGRLDAALGAVVARGQVRLSRAGGALRPALLRGQVAERRRALGGLGARLGPASLRGLAARRELLLRSAARLDGGLLLRDLGRVRQRLGSACSRLGGVAVGQVARWRARLDGLERMRQSLGYTETLRRGYAVVRGPGGVITTRAAAGQVQALEIEFQDGRLGVQPVGPSGPAAPGGAAPAPNPIPTPAPAPQPRRKAPPGQGSLF